MTTVPRSAPKRNDTRKYSLWEWTRGYLVLLATLPFFPWMWLFDRTKLPAWVTAKLLRAHIDWTDSRQMDFRIPPDPSVPAYMFRWWRVPRNWAVNVYFHWFRRSDDDRAHHDHPWWSFSIVLDNGYFEHEVHAGGVITRTWFGPGSMRFRWHGRQAHRIELLPAWTGEKDAELPTRTIFITGPVLRRWGFHDGLRGWVDAYDWDRHCEQHGLKAMRMDGGSDAVVSERNHHRSN